MKPFEQGTDGEFIARMYRTETLTPNAIDHLVSLIALARNAAAENKLRMRPQERITA